MLCSFRYYFPSSFNSSSKATSRASTKTSTTAGRVHLQWLDTSTICPATWVMRPVSRHSNRTFRRSRRKIISLWWRNRLHMERVMKLIKNGFETLLQGLHAEFFEWRKEIKIKKEIRKKYWGVNSIIFRRNLKICEKPLEKESRRSGTQTLWSRTAISVSYTHLTLPTILLV